MTDRTGPSRGRLRIAFLAASLDAGGAERQMILLASELRDVYDVRILVMRYGGLFMGMARKLGIDVQVLGWSERPWREAPMAYGLGVVRASVRYLRLTRGFAVVDAWLPPAYVFAGLIQPLARIRVLVAGRRAMWNPTLAVGPLPRQAGSLAMRQFDAVVANSSAAARAAIEEEGVRQDLVRVIRNGIYPPAQPQDDDRIRLRRTWGIANDQLIVGSVANYRPGKGVETVVELAHRLRSERPELRYILVGEGPLRPALEQRIAELRLADIVTLHGAHPDAQQLYPAFDVVLHASENEGLPNVILEAAAWGRPILATDVGGTGEIVRHRREALLVPARDFAALANGLLELVGDAALRRRLGAAARVRGLEFSPQRLAAETSSLYAELLGARRSRVGATRTSRLRRRSGSATASNRRTHADA